LAEGLAVLARDAASSSLLDYAPVDGAEAHRRAVAEWIRRTTQLAELDWQRLILCNGAQHAMHLAVSTLCSPGDVVLCEASTFPGMKAIAALAGIALAGVALDREGIEPEALDRRAAATGARILYVTPTLQNPTARTMGMARRQAIVEIARKRDLFIVEDDVYATYAAAMSDVLPLASLAPERSFYLGSASKSVAPGLRAGWLLPPSGSDWRERIVARLRASALALPAFGHALFARWVAEGEADAIIDVVRAEMRLRLDAARRVLGGVLEAASAPCALHVFAPLAPLEAERCFARAMEGGVVLTPPSAVMVDQGSASGLRICLGAAHDMGALTEALRVLADVFAGRSSPFEQAVL
jgi:DNA-binding transcriptional MocR family regulator